MPLHRVAAVAFAAYVASIDAKGIIKLDWSDCGGSSTHGHITSLSPATLTLGTKTTITGKGKTNEYLHGVKYSVSARAGIIPIFSHKGDSCKSEMIKLPLGSGKIHMKGFNCPVKAGKLELKLDITMSSTIPAKLARSTIEIKATTSSGDKLLCIKIKTSPATMEGEREVHPERAAQIAEIQATEGVLWKAEANSHFGQFPPGASKALNGVIGDWNKDVEEAVARGEIERFVGVAEAEIPDSFDSAENWPSCAKMIGDIRDQSNCGCCWAFAGAEAASDRMCIASNGSNMIPLSAQDVCFNGGGFMSHGCNGGQITSPWSFMKKGGLFGGGGAVSGGQYQGSGPFGKGFCADFSMPHCHHHGPQGSDPYPKENDPGCPHQNSAPKFSKCDDDATSPHNDFKSDKFSYDGKTITANGVENIQQAIMAGGPMEVAFTVYEDFENYAGGIYHHVSGGMAGGHAVKVVGWGVEDGTKYWKIANSWNPYWGEKGYFRIKFGEGGIDDQAVASDPAAKWSRAGDASIVI